MTEGICVCEQCKNTGTVATTQFDNSTQEYVETNCKSCVHPAEVWLDQLALFANFALTRERCPHHYEPDIKEAIYQVRVALKASLTPPAAMQDGGENIIERPRCHGKPFKKPTDVSLAWVKNWAMELYRADNPARKEACYHSLGSEIQRLENALSAKPTQAEDIPGLASALNNLGDAQGDWAQFNEKDMRDLRVVITAAKRYSDKAPVIPERPLPEYLTYEKVYAAMQRINRHIFKTGQKNIVKDISLCMEYVHIMLLRGQPAATEGERDE